MRKKLPRQIPSVDHTLNSWFAQILANYMSCKRSDIHHGNWGSHGTDGQYCRDKICRLWPTTFKAITKYILGYALLGSRASFTSSELRDGSKNCESKYAESISSSCKGTTRWVLIIALEPDCDHYHILSYSLLHGNEPWLVRKADDASITRVKAACAKIKGERS